MTQPFCKLLNISVCIRWWWFSVALCSWWPYDNKCINVEGYIWQITWWSSAHILLRYHFHRPSRCSLSFGTVAK